MALPSTKTPRSNASIAGGATPDNGGVASTAKSKDNVAVVTPPDYETGFAAPAALTVDPSEFHNIVPPDKVRAVLRALDNDARYKMVCLLRKSPMGVSQLAREVGISQPTATAYINLLQEAGIVSCRFERTPQGFQKICYTIFDGISLSWQPPHEEARRNVYSLDVPIGHYTYIECRGRSFLADQSQIIASPDSVSRFFNPVRMGGELLVLGSGTVRYLFPYNLNENEGATQLRLSIEVACSVPDCVRGARLNISLNGFSFEPVDVLPSREHFEQLPSVSWLPSDMPSSGNLLTIEVNSSLAMINSQAAGNFTLRDLNLCATRPVEMVLEVSPQQGVDCGIVLFGKEFGKYRQDIRMSINHGPRENGK